MAQKSTISIVHSTLHTSKQRTVHQTLHQTASALYDWSLTAHKLPSILWFVETFQLVTYQVWFILVQSLSVLPASLSVSFLSALPDSES